MEGAGASAQHDALFSQQNERKEANNKLLMRTREMLGLRPAANIKEVAVVVVE